MKKMTKVFGLLAVVTVLALSTVGSVFAGNSTNAYGIVFIDSNLNGVYDAGEEGYMGEYVEYYDDDGLLVQEYVGATISLSPDSGETTYTLTSAGYTVLTDAQIEDGFTAVCTYQDYTVADGDDDDELVDINDNPVIPCEGTWAMPVDSGEDGMMWTIWVTAPDGYAVTSENPQTFTINSDDAAVNFGIAPIGAGGDVEAAAVSSAEDTSAVLLPVTGGIGLGLCAAGMILAGGALVKAGRKIEK